MATHQSRRSSLNLFALIGSIALSMAAWGARAQDHTYKIPAEPLSNALRDYGRASGRQIIFTEELVRGRTASEVKGPFSPDAALARLLQGTGLVSQVSPSGAIMIEKESPAPTQTGAERASQVQEVIVTATKRPEVARKISGSVTAFSGDQLDLLGAQSMEDYLTRTPGVVFNADIPGLSPVVIRGVATTTTIDPGQGTVGYFINDVPLTDPFSSVAIPDIDTFDVDNVAVLRGPQGTLFGSASLGGSIDYVAAAPNLNAFQARVQGTLEDTDHGGVGGSGKVMINIPLLSGKLAVRGVYIYRQDAGYIDNIGTGQKDSNSTLVRGGRVEVTWAPGVNTKVNYLFLDQTEDTADAGYEQPVLAGQLAKSTVIPEPYDFRTLIHNIRVDQNLGFATLTATATYHEKDQFSITDDTAFVAGLLPGVSPVPQVAPETSKGTTFEVRLASAAGPRFEYLIGAMHDDTREVFDLQASGPGAEQVIETLYSPFFGPEIGPLGAPNDVFFSSHLPFRGQETAVFGEASYHFSDQWKLTLGGRQFWTRTTDISTESGFIDFLSSGQFSTTLMGNQSESGFTPKGSLTWTPNDDFRAYFLISKGFRFGGPNINPSEFGFTIPPTFGSDSLVNYEFGIRSDWFDKRLLFDAAAFYIDWSNIQLRLHTPLGLSYAANAGKAINYGFEGALTFRVTPDLIWSTNLTYLNATLGQDFNPGGAEPIIVKGTLLPGAAKWQVSDSLIYFWSKAPLSPMFVIDNRYISRAPGDFMGGVPEGDYNLFDFRVRIAIKGLDITAFVNNIGDSRGVTTGSFFPGSTPLDEFVVRPRTFGLTLDYRM